MTTTTAYKKGSTQAFTEIVDIREDIVLMKGGNACVVIEVQAVNFTLLSAEEQDVKVYGYAALLNSLSFPIQILIRSKKVDIVPYIASIGEAAQKATNPKLHENIQKYKQFVEQLITSTTVLDKQFFLVISYSLLEEGAGGAIKIGKSSPSDLDDFFIRAKASLHTKSESLLSQVSRMALRAKVLEGEGLIQLFHDIFNE